MRQLLLALAALVPACITPQIVKPAGVAHFEMPSELRALNTELAEVDVGTGEKLRGVFVPAKDGAPVVLHFLGAQTSVTTGQEFAGLTFDIDGLFEQLQRNGFASLALDYRGVGASDGTCASSHLSADALAAWNEALRRAGGDPTRVVVRGMSIGTLAAASLLQHGVRPALVELIAPVRAETIAHNWLAHYDSKFEAAVLSPFLRKPVDIDLIAAVKNADARIVVFAGKQDDFLDANERKQLVDALRNARGRWIERDLDHFDLVHAGYEICDEELGEFARKYPSAPFAYRYPPSCVLPLNAVPARDVSLPPTTYDLRPDPQPNHP